MGRSPHVRHRRRSRQDHRHACTRRRAMTKTAAKRGVTRDQQLIISLLCGRIAREKHQEAYLKDGSIEELEARRALTRLLRTSRPLDLGVRFVLADLIDPDQDAV